MSEQNTADNYYIPLCGVSFDDDHAVRVVNYGWPLSEEGNHEASDRSDIQTFYFNANKRGG